jgi:hypothetical protein
VLTQGRAVVQALTPGEGVPVAVLRGQSLTAPSIDGTGAPGRGWIWAASAVPGGALWAGRLDHRQVPVTVPWLGTGTITAARISPEGTRALLVVRRGTTTEVVVTGVVRAPDGTPRSLAKQALTLLPDLVAATDAVWSAPDTAAVLGVRRGTDGTFVWNVHLGGEADELVLKAVNARRGLQGLAVSENGIDVYVRIQDGRALGSETGSWKDLEITAPVMPG